MIGRSGDVAEAAQALERVRDLLGLEGELGGVGHVLEPAPAAAPEVGARGLHPLGRGLDHRLDHAAPEARASLHEPDLQPIARQPAGHEHHVTVGAPDALAAEGQVVDRQGQNLPALGSGHGSDTINARPIGVNLTSARHASSQKSTSRR